jgi:hypothetical protein
VSSLYCGLQAKILQTALTAVSQPAHLSIRYFHNCDAVCIFSLVDMDLCSCAVEGLFVRNPRTIDPHACSVGTPWRTEPSRSLSLFCFEPIQLSRAALSQTCDSYTSNRFVLLQLLCRSRASRAHRRCSPDALILRAQMLSVCLKKLRPA